MEEGKRRQDYPFQCNKRKETCQTSAWCGSSCFTARRNSSSCVGGVVHENDYCRRATYLHRCSAERNFSFWGSALQVFGQCGGAKCGLGFAKTIFWGKGFGKTETDFVFAFVRAEEGSGEESARASLSDFFGDGLKILLTQILFLNQKIVQNKVINFSRTNAIECVLRSANNRLLVYIETRINQNRNTSQFAKRFYQIVILRILFAPNCLQSSASIHMDNRWKIFLLLF